MYLDTRVFLGIMPNINSLEYKYLYKGLILNNFFSQYSDEGIMCMSIRYCWMSLTG